MLSVGTRTFCGRSFAIPKILFGGRRAYKINQNNLQNEAKYTRHLHSKLSQLGHFPPTLLTIVRGDFKKANFLALIQNHCRNRELTEKYLCSRVSLVLNQDNTCIYQPSTAVLGHTFNIKIQ